MAQSQSTVSKALPYLVAGGAFLGIAWIANRQLQRVIQEYEQQEARAAGPAVAVPAGDSSASASTSSGPSAQAQQPAEQQEATESRSLGASTSGSSAPAAEGSCSQCGKARNGKVLLRCSRCKARHYCSLECQREAWPSHKQECAKLRAAADRHDGQQDGQNRDQLKQRQQNGDGASSSLQQHQQQEVKSAGDADVMAALGSYIEQHAASREDPLQRSFETGVLLFVRSDYREAIKQLQLTHAKALETGHLALAGDTLRWLGHAHNRLSDVVRAATCFAQGCEMAQRTGNKKLQVECLSGLGCMHRGQGQMASAVGFLREALAVAEKLPDQPDVRASVLCNLGAAEISSDAEAAMEHLREAVDIRELQVVNLHNSGQQNGLATAIMEHASAMVNLAGAYYVLKRYEDANEAYARALQVFELVEDVDKMAKSLINLANLSELQLTEPNSKATAAEHRKRLYEISTQYMQRSAPDSCSICMEPVEPCAPTPDGDEAARLIVLGCLHCFHNKCWADWSDRLEQASCPNCKAPVPLM